MLWTYILKTNRDGKFQAFYDLYHLFEEFNEFRSCRAHVQFQDRMLDEREKRQTVIEASRETKRIQEEDERLQAEDRYRKDKARESLEAQMDKAQTVAKRTYVNDQRASAFKDNVSQR